MWRPERRHYVAAAARVLAISPEQVDRFPNLTLAESALAAPFAGFGDQDAYPTFELKAAVLLERLAHNHPLPDGNKRAAFVLTVLFCESNGRLGGSRRRDRRPDGRACSRRRGGARRARGLDRAAHRAPVLT